MQTAVAVVGRGRLPAGQLVSNEGLNVLALEIPGEERLGVDDIVPLLGCGGAAGKRSVLRSAE
jgi:hypothetical protein